MERIIIRERHSQGRVVDFCEVTELSGDELHVMQRSNLGYTWFVLKLACSNLNLNHVVAFTPYGLGEGRESGEVSFID
jgi:hypothetical protein